MKNVDRGHHLHPIRKQELRRNAAVLAVASPVHPVVPQWAQAF